MNRRDKLGKLSFPRLRQSLVTRWGKYAWYKGNFDLDQNLLIAPTTYRGRPVSDINIQVSLLNQKDFYFDERYFVLELFH